MPIFKISGNYTEVAKLLNLAYLCGSDDLSKYLTQIKKDLKRTCYLSLNKTAEEMQLALLDITPLAEKSYSYTQGNFDAACFSIEYLRERHFNAAGFASEEKTIEDDFYGFIRTAYETDDRKNCGICIAYLRDDAKPIIPVKERKRPLILAIIENTMLAPDDRAVTCFIDSDLIPEHLKPALFEHGTIIDGSQLSQEIHATVKQKYVSDLFSKLISVNGLINLEAFNALESRLKTDANIDNRDFKRTQFNEFLDFINQNLPIHHDVDTYLRWLKNEFSSSIDVAEDHPFEEFLHDLSSDLIMIYENNGTDARIIERLKYIIKLSQLAIELELIASKHSAGKEKDALLLQADLLRKKRAETNSSDENLSLEELIQTAPYTFEMLLEFRDIVESLKHKALDPFQNHHIGFIIHSEIASTFQDQDKKIQATLNEVLKFHNNVLLNPTHFDYKKEIPCVIDAINHSECGVLKAIIKELPRFVDSVLITEYESKSKKIMEKIREDKERTLKKDELYDEIKLLLSALTYDPFLQERLKILITIEAIIDWKNHSYNKLINESFNTLNSPSPILEKILNLALEIDFEKHWDAFNIKIDTLSETNSILHQQSLKIRAILEEVIRDDLHALDKPTQTQLRNTLKYCSDCENAWSLKKLKAEIESISLNPSNLKQLTDELTRFMKLASCQHTQTEESPNNGALMNNIWYMLGLSLSISKIAFIGPATAAAYIGSAVKAAIGPTTPKITTAAAGPTLAKYGIFNNPAPVEETRAITEATPETHKELPPITPTTPNR